MKKLLILSGKGGTGKTTVASSFIYFSGAKAIADCDVDAPNLHLIAIKDSSPILSDFLGGDKAYIEAEKCLSCGVCASHCRFDAIKKEKGSYKIDEFACEGCGVCALVCPQKAVKLHTDIAGQKELYKGSTLLSSAALKMGRGNSGKLVSEVKTALIKNAPDTPLAIIDGSPGIGCPVMASIGGMDLVLIVAEPSESGFSDIRRLVKTCRNFYTKLVLCINKWDINPLLSEKIEAFCKEEKIPFAGKIPYDRSVSKAINAGLSPAEFHGPTRDALNNIYNETIKLL